MQNSPDGDFTIRESTRILPAAMSEIGRPTSLTVCNMLAKRIHIQNPTAIRIGAGILEDYRLDFHTSSKNWLGAPATIVPSSGSHMYGAVWEIDNCNLEDLDNQESVAEGVYVPISVTVRLISTESILQCRAYHLTNQPNDDLSNNDDNLIPYNRKPSQTYLKVLVKGAIETGIPHDYVNWLRRIKHNGESVEILENQLELYNVRLFN